MKKIEKYVFDSYSIFAYFEGEKGADKVAEIIKKALTDNAKIYMSVINWGEVYYIVLREQGAKQAEFYLKTIEHYPIELITVNESFVLEAGRFKAFYKMSYADAFAAALTKNKKAKLVTGDKEFKQINNKIKIEWL